MLVQSSPATMISSPTTRTGKRIAARAELPSLQLNDGQAQIDSGKIANKESCCHDLSGDMTRKPTFRFLLRGASWTAGAEAAAVT